MARIKKKIDADPSIEWYAKKMKTDTSSVSDSAGVDAFVNSAIRETFSTVRFDEKENSDTKTSTGKSRAFIEIDGHEVQVDFDLASSVLNNDWQNWIKCEFIGSDQPVSNAAERLLRKLESPRSVSGEHIFGKKKPDEDEDASDGDALGGLDAIMLLPAKLIVTLGWCVFGLLLWLQVLVRTHLFVSALMAASVLSGKRSADVNKLIRYANTFWVRGFRNISNFGTKTADDDDVDIFASMLTLFVESVASMAFYGGIFFLLR